MHMCQSGSFMQRRSRAWRSVRILTRKGGTSTLRISTITACALALSSSVALAQNPMPPGPYAAPGAAGMSSSDYSSGAQMQYGAQPQQAQGPGMTAGQSDNPRAGAITDEYGNRYNSRGDKIGRGQPARMR